VPDLSGGTAFVDVMPSMRGYFQRVRREIQGNPVEHKIEPTVDKSALDKAKKDLERAQKTVEASSQKVQALRRREADAAGAAEVAEAKLQSLRERGVTDVGRLTAAEQSLAKAKRASQAASEELQRAEAAQRAAADAQRSAQSRVARVEARFDGQQAEQEADGFFSRILRRADDTGPGIGSRIASGVGRTLKTGLVAAGGAAAGFLGTAITLGIGRLTAIDDARGKLRGLGHDAASIDTIMTSALESVKGTAFGLGDAATIAASAVAAGIAPGKELTRYLKLTADAASIAGASLDEMGSIFNKVQTNGVAMTDDLQQLADRGIPIFTWLQKEYGVTGDALRDMVTKGQVDAATFQKVIEQNIGGAALASGSTVSGAFDNAKAALGRFGAALIGPFFDQATGVLGTITGKLDEMTNRVGPWAQKVSDSIRFAFELLVSGNYDGALGAALGLEEDSPIVAQLLSFRDKVGQFVDEYGPRLSDVFGKLRDAAIAAAPAVKEIVTSLGTAMGSAGLTTWELLVRTLEALAPAIETVLIPALGTLAGLMSENQGAVNTLIGGYLGFHAVGTVFDTAISGLESIKGAVGEVTGVIDTGKELYQTYTDATYGIAQAQSTLSGKMAAAAGAIRGKAAAENLSTLAATRALVAEKLHAGAMKVKAIAVKAATAAQWLWNAALNANPIGLILVAIAALVAGLVWFFTKTETGRRLWETIWAAISGAVKWAWENVIKPAWEGIQAGFAMIGQILQWVWDNVLSPVFTAIKYAVGIVLAAFVLLGMIFGVVWDAIVAVAQWAWNTVLRPVFDAIMWVFGQVGAFFGWVWNTLIKPAWDALAFGISWVWENIIRPAWDALTAALTAIGNFFVWVWNTLIKPAWDALGAGIAWVWDTIIRPAWDALTAALQAVGNFFTWIWNSVIKPAWDALGAGIKWVVDNVLIPIWDTLKGALDLVGRAFESVVDWIGRVWDRIKAIAAKPVRFIVETVYNKGIVAAWNKVAGWLDIEPLQEADLGELGHYAVGGRVRGPGGPADDKVPAMLSNGEYVVRTEAARAIGYDTLDRLNRRPRRMGESDYFHYAGGGRVQGGAELTTEIQRSMWDAVRTAFPGAVLTSGTRYQDVGSGYDFHMAGQAIDLGGPMQQIASWIAATYPNSLELFWDPGPNIDEGRPTGAIGGHSDHVHWAMSQMVTSDGRLVSAEGGSRGGGAGFLRRLVAGLFDGVMDPIGRAIPEFGGGQIGRLPKLAFDKFRNGVRDWILNRSDAVEGSSVPGSGPVVDQVRQAFAPYGWDTGAQWDAVDYIVSRESSWNPLARNPSSGAFGLFQFLGSTKDQYLPDENPNPLIQGQAGARYISDRYGDPLGARSFWEANHWYDDGGIARGRGIMMKDIIRPERVLDPDMTRSFDEKLIPILDRLTSLSVDDVLTASDRNALVSVDLSGAQIYGQYIEQQHVVDDKATARSVRRETKRAMVEAGLG